ncbi:2-amino-4-hydroxy-6-hydroxymethyldihydropteridine diphosphokinase [Aquibacillus kalidii]|uniref:2-amino-4-hydroxy-6- hydroxymethyldihydropteridine diphosphokinase n=1 Tax=Aquibacillus kalidii TaxID=2762597 RepID=UPI001644AB7F|nr:2-amino-4-hydroxy-6-hydroxymethyldihydropteridine diphosphokinase [Aquibacillus kalidii]
MNTAYIALGSNIKPRDHYLNQAIKNLETDDVKLVNKSSVYETDPVGYTEQDNFLNMVLEIETNLDPINLLLYCQSVELQLGRKRKLRWGPRTIDLDILLYNQENIKTEQLTVPHPRMNERAFVLIPLNELNPLINIPLINKSVSSILDGVSPEEKKGVIKWMPSNGEGE